MAAVMVKPWGKDQGDFVLINAEDFDETKHELFEVTGDGSGVALPEIEHKKRGRPAKVEQ